MPCSLIGNSLYREERGEGRGRGVRGVEDGVYNIPLYVAVVPFQLLVVTSHPLMKFVNKVTCTGCQLTKLFTDIRDR